MGEDPNAIRAGIERTRAEMGDTVEALGYKADVKSRARDRISETKNKLTGRASDVAPDGQQVKRAAGVAQENPLGLAIGGVAVGFIAGLLVPTSRVEDEKIGPLADQVKDQIKDTGQEAMKRGKDVAQQAAQSAKDTAQEAGRQHADELRDSAEERAQTVAPRCPSPPARRRSAGGWAGHIPLLFSWVALWAARYPRDDFRPGDW
jgi:gas vesicle protein